MTRNLLRTLLATVLLCTASFVTHASPAGARTYPSRCPAMTDSITRLYRAFFDRDPDPNGFRHWVSVYQSGRANLADIAQSFATADEFVNRFLDNEQYVDWLYNEVLGPDYITDREHYWVQILERGYRRGSVALAFTESREYVEKTNTTMPLAGFLRWYPSGTHWYCDIGTITATVEPLIGEVWADFYFHNRSNVVDPIELWTLEADGRRHIRMNSNDLGAGLTDYDWDGSFSGDGDYGRAIEVRAGGTTDWIVVFYPRTMGPDRLGWQLT